MFYIEVDKSELLDLEKLLTLGHIEKRFPHCSKSEGNSTRDYSFIDHQEAEDFKDSLIDNGFNPSTKYPVFDCGECPSGCYGVCSKAKMLGLDTKSVPIAKFSQEYRKAKLLEDDTP